MALLTEEMRALIRNKALAHLALVDERGRPHVSPVWIDVDDEGRVVVNTAEGRKKARLLQVGATVSLTALLPERPNRWVGVRGTVVERTHEGARELIDRLAQRYWGRRYDAPPGMQRVTIRIEPEWTHLYER